MLIQGQCDPKFGPVVRVAVRSANVTHPGRRVFVWVYGVLREDSPMTVVSDKIVDELWLWSDGDIRIVSLLLRGYDSGDWAIFRDLTVDKLDPFLTPSHSRFINPDPRIDVVIGQDIVNRGTLVQHSDMPEPKMAGFAFHVDTGTGVLPVCPAN